VLDVSEEGVAPEEKSDRLKKLGAGVAVKATDTCFVMQPFAPPLGDYYEKILKPAIEKAGLQPVRADAEIFATGKIIDQVWRGINAAKVLVAELTTRNPNVCFTSLAWRTHCTSPSYSSHRMKPTCRSICTTSASSTTT
jgi:hypothetical protein